MRLCVFFYELLDISCIYLINSSFIYAGVNPLFIIQIAYILFQLIAYIFFLSVEVLSACLLSFVSRSFIKQALKIFM